MKSSAGLIPLVLLSALAACAAPPPEADLVIRNARLLVGDGTVVDAAAVVVEDGRIVAVGEEVGDWRGRAEIDAAGRTVLPGLIDTHVHLLALASESAETVARFRRERLPGVLTDFLTQGVTTVRSTGDPLPAIAEVREALRSGSLAGPRLLTSGPVLGPKDGHPAVTVCGGGAWAWCRENLVRELEDSGSARNAVAELAGAGVDFIKVVHEDIMGARLDRAVLEAIVEEAKSHGLKVFVHASPSELAIEALEAGADGLVHTTFGRGVGPRALVEAVGDRPVSSTLGLSAPVEDEEGNLRTPYGGEWNEQRERTREGMRQATTALWQGRALLAFGTDTPTLPPEQGFFHEVGALTGAGLTPSDVLLMATRNAARALGLEDEIGTLEAGKRADLVMVNGHPDADLEALERIALVVKNGAVVVDQR